MSRRYVFSLFVLFLLMGCGGTPTPTSTPVSGVGNAAIELIQQDMYIRLTEQAVENERIRQAAIMTATQQIVAATATQQAHQENIQSTRRAEGATQQAWQVTVAAGRAQDQATQQAAIAQASATASSAAVTATQQAEATQMAYAVATDQSYRFATATSAWQTQQAPVVHAQATALFAQARKTEIELQKATATMWVSAWGGWIFAAVVTVVAIFVTWKKSQVGVIPTDQNGKAQLVVINQGGQKILVSPGLMAAPTLTMTKIGASMPMLVDPALQERVTHGAQVIDAIRSLPPGYNRQAVGMAAGLTNSQAAPAVNIQVVQPGQVNGWLEDVTGQMSAQVEEDE